MNSRGVIILLLAITVIGLIPVIMIQNSTQRALTEHNEQISRIHNAELLFSNQAGVPVTVTDSSYEKSDQAYLYDLNIRGIRGTGKCFTHPVTCYILWTRPQTEQGATP